MQSEPSSSAAGTPSRKIDEYYSSALADFTDNVGHAVNSSYSASGLDAGPRRYWASVLFTRLCTTSLSILFLCPRSKVNPNGKHWDFGSIASLSRNLYECALHFFYLAIESVSEDEWLLRLKVMQLHDCKERQRMFRAFDPNDPQLARFEQQADELKQIIKKNPCFARLSKTLQEVVLKAERPSILTQDEIMQRMGHFDPKTRGYYRYLSSHAHSFPLAYYRMGEHVRGRGVENEGEKGYIGSTLEFCTDLLAKSTEEFQRSFADIVSFVPAKSFNWEVLKGPHEKDGFAP